MCGEPGTITRTGPDTLQFTPDPVQHKAPMPTEMIEFLTTPTLLAKALDLLEKLEWNEVGGRLDGDDPDMQWCIGCDGNAQDGHSSPCDWLTLMKEAGRR